MRTFQIAAALAVSLAGTTSALAHPSIVPHAHPHAHPLYDALLGFEALVLVAGAALVVALAFGAALARGRK